MFCLHIDNLQRDSNEKLDHLIRHYSYPSNQIWNDGRFNRFSPSNFSSPSALSTDLFTMSTGCQSLRCTYGRRGWGCWWRRQWPSPRADRCWPGGQASRGRVRYGTLGHRTHEAESEVPPRKNDETIANRNFLSALLWPTFRFIVSIETFSLQCPLPCHSADDRDPGRRNERKRNGPKERKETVTEIKNNQERPLSKRKGRWMNC